MKIARKIVAMLTMTILLCVLLASTAFAAETGSMWVAVEQDEGTEALITTDTIVTDGVVKVSYNSELLTYESIEISQTYVAMYAVNAEEPGVVRISWVGKGDQELEDDAVCLIRLNFTGTGENNQIVLTGSAHGADGSTLTLADDSDTTAPEDSTASTEESAGDKQPESSSAATEEATDAAGVGTEEPNAGKNTEGSSSVTEESLETQEQDSANVEQSNDPNGDGENNSSTGDTSVIWLAMAVCILSAVAIITLLLGKQHGKGGYAV